MVGKVLLDFFHRFYSWIFRDAFADLVEGSEWNLDRAFEPPKLR